MHYTVVEREDDRGRSIVAAHFVEDTPDVCLDRAFAEQLVIGDLVVRQASPDEPQHVELALRQACQAGFTLEENRSRVRRQHAPIERRSSRP